MRNSRFEGLTNRSPLLAQILEQMQQHSVYQPQSYGALAAGLGASYLQQKTLHNELMREQKAKEAQGQGLAQALSKFQQDSQGGMQSLPGTGVQLDTLPDPNARQSLMGSLVQNENPMAQGLASQLMAQQFAPPPDPVSMDLGDRIALRQGNQIVGEFPKSVTPDTQAREGGEDRRLGARFGFDEELAKFKEKSINDRFNIGEQNANSRAQMGADNRTLASTQKLRKEFEQLIPVQQYRKVLPQMQGVMDAPDTAAGDMAVINGVAKIMDPDTGIREQDVNNVLRSQSPMQVVMGNIRFYVDGKGRITPQSRKELQDSAGAKVGGFKTAYDSTREQYSKYAGQQGVEAFDVVGDPIDAPFKNRGIQQIQNDDEYNKLPSGTEFMGPDGVKRKKP